MSNQFLSFGLIPKLCNNNKKETSPIGEISNKSYSYCKNPGIFEKDGSNNTLYVFYSLTDQKNFLVMPDDVAYIQIELIDWLYNESISNNLDESNINCKQNLISLFGDKITIKDVGKMVTNNKYWLPSFVKCEFTDSKGDINYLTFWLADEYFRQNFPYKEIQVGLPLPDESMDDLFNLNYHELEDLLKTQTPIVIQDRINEKTDAFEYPYTERKVYGFEAWDQINTAHHTTIYFVVQIWGNTYDVEDEVYDAIRDAILKISKKDEDEWANVLPDLFNPLEFTCVPYFNRMGLENNTEISSTFSPITDYETSLVLPKKYLPSVTEQHLIKSLQIVPFIYKSLNIAFIAKEKNYKEQFKIYDFISDYQLIYNINDTNFSKMSTETIKFIDKFNSFIEAAISITPYDLPPSGMNINTKNGIVILSMRIDKVKYHMVTYHQYKLDGVV